MRIALSEAVSLNPPARLIKSDTLVCPGTITNVPGRITGPEIVAVVA